MDIGLSEDQTLFRETTGRFLDAECPLTKVRGLRDDATGHEPSYWRSGAELGWTSLLVGEADGGGSISGRGLCDLAVVAEEMGRLCSPGPLAPVNVVAQTLSTSGTDAQKATHLGSLLDGSLIAAWAFNEPAMRWDAARTATSARRDGDGYVLNGTKIQVEAAAQAGLLLVTARVDGELAQFLVPSSTDGVRVVATESLDLVRRYGDVHLSEVRAGADAIIGTPADVERQLHTAIVIQSAETCGVMQRVLDMTIEYLGDRYLFGRPLAGYQALKHRCADWKYKLESCHALTQASAKAVADGADDHDTRELVSATKAYVGSVSTELVQDCVQLHGGIGVTWEHDIHIYLRRATVNRGVHGSPIEHRERIASLLELV